MKICELCLGRKHIFKIGKCYCIEDLGYKKIACPSCTILKQIIDNQEIQEIKQEIKQEEKQKTEKKKGRPKKHE